MRPLLLLLLLAAGVTSAQEVRVAFWNVENLYDTRDDTITRDDDFTPTGANHWTYSRYWQKQRDLYKAIMAMDSPDVVGLAEVENRYVLSDLCQGTPLARMGYRWVHYDSPDRRGIDCALIYRGDRFAPYFSEAICVSDSASGFFTRDLLHVEGLTPQGDTLILFVCHLPSRLGGEPAEVRRQHCAARLREAMDDARVQHPGALVMAMGDFNSNPGELLALSDLRSLTAGQPSYCYQGQWSCIDQLLLLQEGPFSVDTAAPFRHPHLLESDPRYGTVKPRRTYRGPRYHGGVSDHLPVFVRLRRKG